MLSHFKFEKLTEHIYIEVGGIKRLCSAGGYVVE